MLASSPPSPFTRRGDGISMHSSPSSTTRQAASSSQSSRRTSAQLHAPSSSAAHESNYRNASTQWSPLAPIPQDPPTRAPPIQARAVAQHNPQEDSGQSSSGSSSSLQPVTVAETFSNPSQTHSPSSRRRPFTESGETESGSATSLSSSPKRTRPSKATAKKLPVRYEFCEVEDMVTLIADMISELITTNDSLPLNDVVLTRFHSRTAPGISVFDYLQRLAKHATLSPPLLLSMVYYIDRLCSLYPAFSITSLTVHRFLITAATVAAKGLSDSFWNNSTYARVGGIKLAELGLLELEFLYRLDWRIVPNPEVLVDYYRGLVARNENYILEGDDPMETAMDLLDQGQSRSDDEASTAAAQAETETQWEEWMKDVARGSNQPDARRG